MNRRLGPGVGIWVRRGAPGRFSGAFLGVFLERFVEDKGRIGFVLIFAGPAQVLEATEAQGFPRDAILRIFRAMQFHLNPR